jgi:hypothetical protein
MIWSAVSSSLFSSNKALEVRDHLSRLVVVVAGVDDPVLAHSVYHLLAAPFEARKRVPKLRRVEGRASPLSERGGRLLYLLLSR